MGWDAGGRAGGRAYLWVEDNLPRPLGLPERRARHGAAAWSCVGPQNTRDLSTFRAVQNRFFSTPDPVTSFPTRHKLLEQAWRSSPTPWFGQAAMDVVSFFPWNTAAVGASIKDIDVALLDGSLDSYYGLWTSAVWAVEQGLAQQRRQNPYGVSGFLCARLPFALTSCSATLLQGKGGRSDSAPQQR